MLLVAFPFCRMSIRTCWPCRLVILLKNPFTHHFPRFHLIYNWITVAWKRLVRGPEAHLLLQPLSKRNWEASRPLALVEQMLTCYSWPSDDRSSLSGKESVYHPKLTDEPVILGINHAFCWGWNNCKYHILLGMKIRLAVILIFTRRFAGFDPSW